MQLWMCVRCNSLTLMFCRPLVGLSKPLPHNKYFCFYTFFFLFFLYLALHSFLPPPCCPFFALLTSRRKGRNDYNEGSCSETKIKTKPKQKSTHKTNNFCFLFLFAFFSTHTHTHEYLILKQMRSFFFCLSFFELLLLCNFFIAYL